MPQRAKSLRPLQQSTGDAAIGCRRTSDESLLSCHSGPAIGEWMTRGLSEHGKFEEARHFVGHMDACDNEHAGQPRLTVLSWHSWPAQQSFGSLC